MATQMEEQAERREVRPVQIIQHEQQRTMFGKRHEDIGIRGKGVALIGGLLITTAPTVLQSNKLRVPRRQLRS